MSGQATTVFTVPGDPRGPMTPYIECKQYEDFWQFHCHPCRYETTVSIFILGSDLLFRMQYNNAGVKLFTDEQNFKVPGNGINPMDLSVEGYRSKNVKLRRPPAQDSDY